MSTPETVKSSTEADWASLAKLWMKSSEDSSVVCNKLEEEEKKKKQEAEKLAEERRRLAEEEIEKVCLFLYIKKKNVEKRSCASYCC